MNSKLEFATDKRPNGVQFHKIGVGAKNGDGIVQVFFIFLPLRNYKKIQAGKRDYQYRQKYSDSKLDLLRTQPMRTLWGLMRELGHTDRIIDIVKIDREGPRKAYEPAVIRNLLEDGTYRYHQVERMKN